MQSRITRIIAAIMALIMVACCFSACKKKNAEEESTTQEIEWPTNPNDDVFVNDGSAVDPNAPGAAQGGNNTANRLPSGTGNSGSISGGSTGGSSGGGTYYPPTGGSTGGSTSGSTNTSTSILNPSYWQKEIEHLKTHFDTPEERQAVLEPFGYMYDAEQNIYYTSKDPWQRQMGFTDLYDQGAIYTSMYYLTFKADFKYDNKLWRLQWWKGQYGVLEGAELGVYIKESTNSNVQFYSCADKFHELDMSMHYYHSLSDYKNGNMLFYRAEQQHWWLTGFKFGYINPRSSVVKATLIAKTNDMANAIEAGLQNLTDGNNNLTGKGFVPYQPGVTETDYYIRDGKKFTIVWYQAGYLNWVAPDTSSQSGSDAIVTE